MANRKLDIDTPIDAEKHPFQIDGLVGVMGPCQMSPMGFVGFFLRLDMPGVPQKGFKFFKNANNKVVTFNATAPRKESFLFEESDRVYAGYLRVNRNPLVIPVQVIGQNGSFLMLFPDTEAAFYFIPPPRSASPQIASASVNSDKEEGSSGKSIDEAEGVLDQINLDAMNLEGSGNSGATNISSIECTKASNCGVSQKSEQGVGSSEKSIDKAEELRSEQSSSNPSVEGSSTEDIIRYVNRLKIKGPDGVCERQLVQEDGQYSLYVRADLPGLDPYLCVTTVRDRCILVYGRPQPQEYYIQFPEARNYLFFIQLRCSCCKFDNLRQDHEDGVLRLFCRIIGPEPAPLAD